MSHVSDPQEALDAAREAAGAGDYPSAERLLRDALAAQEARLGPRHPEIAVTLSGLAVVCDRMERVEEAERLYRRAHAVAVASRLPGDPVVATSLGNLLAFCTARGIPLWRPPAARPAVDTEPTQPESPDAPRHERHDRIAPRSDRGAAVWLAGPFVRRAAVVALVAGPLAVLLLYATSSQQAEPAEIAVDLGPAPGAPALAAGPVPDVAPEPPDDPAPATPPPAPAMTPADSAAAADSPVRVVRAQVCSAFERRGSPDWRCTPAGEVSPPGTFVFYTRVQSAADATVEHRWYRNERLHQTMTLRVGANPGSGFRTYSRTTIGPDRAGTWRVEARGPDGLVLREAHFVVR